MKQIITKGFVSYNWIEFTKELLEWFRLADEKEFVEISYDDIYLISRLLLGVPGKHAPIVFVSMTQTKCNKEYVYTFNDKGYKVCIDTVSRIIIVKKIS